MKKQQKKSCYNDNSKRYTQNYLRNLHQLRVWIKKEEWDAIVKFSEEHGYKSSSAFIKKVLFDAIEKSDFEKIYINASSYEKLKVFATEHGYSSTSEFILNAINEFILRESKKK